MCGGHKRETWEGKSRMATDKRTSGETEETKLTPKETTPMEVQA